MRTKTVALLTAILLIFGISVAAFAQPRGDPPRDDVPTLGTTTELSTPTAPVRERQRVHDPDVMNDQARDRAGDCTTTCTPDQHRDRVRSQERDRAQDGDRACTPRADGGWVEHSQPRAPHRHRSAN
jgi:hypothetical protein